MLGTGGIPRTAAPGYHAADSAANPIITNQANAVNSYPPGAPVTSHSLHACQSYLGADVKPRANSNLPLIL